MPFKLQILEGTLTVQEFQATTTSLTTKMKESMMVSQRTIMLGMKNTTKRKSELRAQAVAEIIELPPLQAENADVSPLVPAPVPPEEGTIKPYRPDY